MSESTQSKRKGRLLTIWALLEPYKRWVALLSILSILVGFLETLLTAALFPILQTSLGIESIASGNPFLRIIRLSSEIIPVESPLVSYCIIFILITVLAFIMWIVYIYFSASISAMITINQKIRVFHKFVKADYQFYIDNRQGDLLFKARGASEVIATVLDRLTQVVAAIILSVLLLALLFSISWKGTLVVLFLGTIFYYFVRYLSVNVSYVAGEKMKAASQDENVALNEYISGVKQITVNRTSPYWLERFNRAVTEKFRSWMKNRVWMEVSPRILQLVMFSSIAIAVIIIWLQYSDSFLIMIPMFGTFAYAMLRIVPKLDLVSKSLMQIMNSLPNIEVVHELLKDQRYETIKDGERGFQKLHSGIEFRNVYFTHKSKETVTLRNISLTINKNKMNAIVGPSGSGKSTLIDLLLRLYDVNDGEILIDGINIKEYNLSSYLKKVGFVGQETFIFNSTIKENIEFGDEFDINDTMEAARMANADDFINQLPDGYNTIVGDRGLRLSGGERQRIAIARAIIRKPDILVLDEATSSLDNISESIVQAAIDRVSEHCTTIVVAHRLSTIRTADIIHVLDKGMIVETGTHDDLNNKGGIYSQLYTIQERESDNSD